MFVLVHSSVELILTLLRVPAAKKLGVTEVSLEVVNFISHATQSRLRSLLEKVSAVAQHRTDGGKARNTQTLLCSFETRFCRV